MYFMQSVTPRTRGIVNLRLRKYKWTEAAHKHQVQVDPPALSIDLLLYTYSVLHTFSHELCSSTFMSHLWQICDKYKITRISLRRWIKIFEMFFKIRYYYRKIIERINRLEEFLLNISLKHFDKLMRDRL